MVTTHFYEVAVDWQSDRKGILSSSALTSTIEVVTPPGFQNGIPGIWSPEHLFVASVNSCFMTTFLAVAENSNLEFAHFHCKGIGKLEQVEGRYMITEVTLIPVVTILHDFDAPKTERILQKSESNCLISNSIKAKVTIKPEIKILNAVAQKEVYHT